MGSSYVAFEALLRELGHEVIIPPKCSKKTLDLGTKYSPETACLPFKINVGNYLEAIEMGAEGIVIVGGTGPCRFGYYGALQAEILADLGIKAEIIILEPPKENAKLLKSQLRRLIAPRGLRSLIKGVILAWEQLRALEILDNAALYARPRENKQGSTTHAYAKAVSELRSENSVHAIRSTTRHWQQQITALATKNIEPLRVGLVGEIYTILEPFVSLNILERLGDLGVEVYQIVSLYAWVRDHMLLNPLHLYSNKPLLAKAHGYLSGWVGGHGLETVARTVMCGENHYDGVVHILPFTCMPEIIAQSILPQISNDYLIPVLSLVVDEHTGIAGFQTRLEAFVDLLARKKQQEVSYEQKASVFGG